MILQTQRQKLEAPAPCPENDPQALFQTLFAAANHGDRGGFDACGCPQNRPGKLAPRK